MKIVLMLSGFCALTGFSSCHTKHEARDAHVVFEATRPLITDTTIEKQYVAQIRSVRHIEIRSQERGYLDKVYVDEGQFVRKGQLLFQIRPNVYHAEVEKAQAEVDAQRIEVQNARLLSDKNIVSPNELSLAKARLNKARAELALAKTHLHFTRITAPYDGFIDHLQLKLGSLVDEGALITTLSDNSQMWVYFNVPEATYLDYKANESIDHICAVSLLMANNTIFPYAGNVKAIEADFNNETGNIAFRATFPNPDNLLRNGQTGNVLMKIPMNHAVIIPQKASFEIMDKKYVYVIDQHHKVKQVMIQVAAELPDLYLLSAGLEGNETILLEGIRKVKEGDKIKFELHDCRQVMARLHLPSE